MKRYKDTAPASLYRDCFWYVVNCTMSNCHHLSMEDAEDITSQAFLELYQNGKTNIQNWVWLAKMRGRWDYVKHYTRSDHVGTSADLPDRQVTEPAFFEMFQFSSLLKRKDAKECLGLVLKGYTSNEIAETLHRTKQGVKTMLYRLRNQAKVTLKRDIELYKKPYKEMIEELKERIYGWDHEGKPAVAGPPTLEDVINKVNEIIRCLNATQRE